MKGRTEYFLGFVGHIISIAAIHLFGRSAKIDLDKYKQMSMAVFHEDLVYKNRWWAGFGLRAIIF